MARPRKQETRSLNPSIFIFCEGSKTEPNYFRALIKFLNFPGELAKVEVIDSEKTNLVGLVDEAKALRDKNKYSTDGDQYWIVVDKDGYTQHSTGFDTAAANSFKVAFSSICFEFWFFCHFEFSTAQKAKCAVLIKEQLSKCIPDYEKGQKDIFSLLNSRLHEACKNAKRIRKHWLDVGDGKPIFELNPYTNVDQLVEKLISYRKEIGGNPKS